MVYIVLFEPEKPANVGNIIRTCMAFDARLIIIGPLSFDMSDKSLQRAGMDYLIGFKIEFLKTMEEFYAKHGNENVYYVTRYSKNVYTRMDYTSLTDDLYLMFGRESTGIPHDILRANLEKTVRIPMVINARSLNLANSVAIVLSEAERQRKFYGLSTEEAIKGPDFLEEEGKKKD
jgi:tRNA (cytidine/uridine-2'-O-)-methyltransferase